MSTQSEAQSWAWYGKSNVFKKPITSVSRFIWGYALLWAIFSCSAPFFQDPLWLFFGFFKISSGCQQCPRRENAADKPPYTERKVILKCDCIEIFFKSNHFSTDIEVLQATFCSTSMILLSRYIILHYSIRYTMHDTIQCNTIQRNTTFQMRLFLQLLIMGEF